jgi:hypothetical protein
MLFDPPTARGEERSRESLYDTMTNSNTPLSLFQSFTEIAQVTGFGNYVTDQESMSGVVLSAASTLEAVRLYIIGPLMM